MCVEICERCGKGHLVRCDIPTHADHRARWKGVLPNFKCSCASAANTPSAAAAKKSKSSSKSASRESKSASISS